MRLNKKQYSWMGFWWLLLITISFASGDLQSYNFYDPDEENMIFEKKEAHCQHGLQSVSNHDVQAEYPDIKRSSKNEEQGRRQQRFHSWGGKRQQTQNDIYNVEYHEPQDDQEEKYIFPKNVYFPMSNFIKGEMLPILVQKRAKHPAFSSWGGKRNLVQKRSYNDFVFQPGTIKTRMVDQNRKRYTAFNSWAGKRSVASFNRWGGKGPASPFNSWGGKRISEEASEFPSIEMNGNKDIYIQNEKIISKNNCMILQAMCNDLCNVFKKIKINKSQYIKWFEARHWVSLNDKTCPPCQCQSWNEQLINNFLQENIFHSLHNLERNKKLWEVIKGYFKFSNENYPPLGKKSYDATNFYTPNDFTSSISFPFENWQNYNFKIRPTYDLNMNFSTDKDESESNEQHQKQNNIWVTPEEFSDKDNSLCEQQDGENDLKCDRYDQKDGRSRGIEQGIIATSDVLSENEKDNMDPIQSFTDILDTENKQDEEPLNYAKHFQSKNADLCDKYNKNHDCDNYFTNNANEVVPNKPDTHLSQYPRIFNLLQKRSALFRNWYEKKVPTMQLSNGKRRPAFSSWGGKRSEHTYSQSNVKKCINGKDCMKGIEEFFTDTVKYPLDEEHTREKRYLKLNNNWDPTYENTLNRNKRSNANIKKNKDITRFVLKGGFVWPFMVKPLSKGVDFYAWGGRR